jgi:hypothetical protein
MGEPKNFRLLCERLLVEDTESGVVDLLSDAGFWNDEHAWRPVGDNPNNRAIIGNQQEDAVSALAEKITNSIDAVLINLARESGITDLRGADAPHNIAEAVRRFLLDGRGTETASLYHLWIEGDHPKELIDRATRLIWVSVTGSNNRPSITVADVGEGQTPDNFSSTFLSLIGFRSTNGLVQSNKLGIRFVQGQFNMGGSGVYPFASREHRLQLLVSRRNPALLPPGTTGRDLEWGFTVVRARQREDLGSIYEYLAPIGAGRIDGEPSGAVLSFAAETFAFLPEAPPRTVPNLPYAKVGEYGSAIKLYDYQYRDRGISVSHALMRDALKSQLELVLPELPIPFRIVEARKGYKGRPGSFQLPVLGLRHRVERLAARTAAEAAEDFDDETDVETTNDEPSSKALELEGPPVWGQIDIQGFRVPWSAYVFREEAGDVTRGGTHSLIFHVNGQKHAHESSAFFRRDKVGLNYLGARKTILVLVDCSNMSIQALERLFKPSRDRMNRTQFTTDVIDLLCDALKTSQQLSDLQMQQRQRNIMKRISEPAPVRDVLARLVQATPSLAQFFRQGMAFPGGNPFPPEGGGTGTGRYEGRPHPSFFHFEQGRRDIVRTAAVGSRARLAFEIDVVNDYFSRAMYPGALSVSVHMSDGSKFDATGARGELIDGAFSYSLVIPADIGVGENFTVSFVLSDDTLVEAFQCTAQLTMTGPQPRSPGGSGKRRTSTSPGGDRGNRTSLDDLDVIVCRRTSTEGYAAWPNSTWTSDTALTVEPGLGNDVTYYVNADNRYLLAYQKNLMSESDIELAEQRFKWASVLLAFSIIRWHKALSDKNTLDADTEVESADSVEWVIPKTLDERDALIRTAAEATAALLLPTMDALSKFEDVESR